MRFTQYYLGCLSQASYLIGDETTGRAAVIDPRRDVGAYLDETAAAGLRVEYVIETHVHADFLSGHLELAALTTLVGERRRHGWQWWELPASLARPGSITILARATDLAGQTQPDRPQWNPLGYANNAIHQVRLAVATA